MKTILTAINSKFSHTNSAIRSISEYIKHHSSLQPEIREFTINQLTSDILRDLVFAQPEILMFSVYIWNVEYTLKVVKEIKKVIPDLIIVLGGPEVSYRAEEILNDVSEIDYIVSGEGEKSDLELLLKLEEANQKDGIKAKNISVDGVYSRGLPFTPRPPFCNLDELYFPYPDLLEKKDPDPDNRIFYYESSRGCPFRCSYCLSSIDKSVRYRALDKVFSELQIFLDANVKLVKFVDRTFNLDEKRTIAIWNYIREHHNGKTMFHFEIAAQQLTEKMLDTIKDFPKGIMQFEIGVQSTNKETLDAIGRPAKLDELSRKIKAVPKTIHSHLDLIAGLPYESLKEFKSSFDYVIKLRPDMLQLGFLKILSGTRMEEFAKNTDYEVLSIPPYEVLQTPYMSYMDLQFLKDLEKVLDFYYNADNFEYLTNYLFSIDDFSIYEFYSSIVLFFREEKLFDVQHKTDAFYKIFWNFVNSVYFEKYNSVLDKNILYELLRFDFIIGEKTSNFPEWYKRNYNKDNHRDGIIKHCNFKTARESYAHSDYEEFNINPLTFEKENTKFIFVYNSVKGRTATKQFFKV